MNALSFIFFFSTSSVAFVTVLILFIYFDRNHHHWERLRGREISQTKLMEQIKNFFYQQKIKSKQKNCTRIRNPMSKRKKAIKKFAMLMFSWKLLCCYFKISVPFVYLYDSFVWLVRCVCFFICYLLLLFGVYRYIYILSAPIPSWVLFERADRQIFGIHLDWGIQIVY